MKTYMYDGPVMHHDKLINKKWTAITTASSEKQAINNLTYRYKVTHGYSATAKITLPEKLKDA